jgi:hypothetical protein
MTTFIFMLTKDAGAFTVERVLHALSSEFPQHEFLAGDADVGGYENSILAMHGSAGDVADPGLVVLPDKSDVDQVNHAFRQIVVDLKGWKPS